MCDKHWTDDEFFARLYDVKPEDDHLAQCASCAQKLNAIQNRYEKLRSPLIDVSPEFLADQRRAIRARTNAKRRTIPRMLVPVVVTLLLAAIVIVYKPVSVVPPAKQQISDSELFDDVYDRISDPLPSSAGPIRSLFEAQK
jgi:hypothetical protein